MRVVLLNLGARAGDERQVRRALEGWADPCVVNDAATFAYCLGPLDVGIVLTSRTLDHVVKLRCAPLHVWSEAIIHVHAQQIAPQFVTGLASVAARMRLEDVPLHLDRAIACLEVARVLQALEVRVGAALGIGQMKLKRALLFALGRATSSTVRALAKAVRCQPETLSRAWRDAWAQQNGGTLKAFLQRLTLLKALHEWLSPRRPTWGQVAAQLAVSPRTLHDHVVRYLLHPPSAVDAPTVIGWLDELNALGFYLPLPSASTFRSP